MDLQYLCTNCLQGMLKNGVCTYCHKRIQEVSKRPASALPERYILGKQYYLGRIIGNGGFGITYLAWDCREQRRVVVKELFPMQDVRREPSTKAVLPLKGQEDFFRKCKQRFKEEAKILYDFQAEPAIMDVYRLMEENNTVYYAMEYLIGFDLRSYIVQKGKLDWMHLSGYVRSILYTLRILHSRGLIHRDISPDNIFLTTVMEAKLIDFGSVRCFNSGQGLTTILKKTYAPIEQYFTSGKQGPWTDIYSLSVTMYYALSGVLPPSAPDRSMKKRETTPLTVLCPQLPVNVARAITKGMEIQASDRYQRVEEMAGDLFPGENIFEPVKKIVNSSRGASSTAIIHGIGGLYNGKRLELFPGSFLTFGRDPRCEVHYPPASPGISRRQFSIRMERDGSLFIQDQHSSYGTFVSGNRIAPDKWYRLRRGSIIRFANESYYVE